LQGIFSSLHNYSTRAAEFASAHEFADFFNYGRVRGTLGVIPTEKLAQYVEPSQDDETLLLSQKNLQVCSMFPLASY